jgi:hypothetical protein
MILALFDQPSFIGGIKKNPLIVLILDQTSCVLGPTIFEIPQPN